MPVRRSSCSTAPTSRSRCSSCLPWTVAGTRVDLATSHASISRSLPAAIARRASDAPDEDAVSRGSSLDPKVSVPERLEITSTTVDDKPLDQLGEVATALASCPSFVAPGLECRVTPPIRATSDFIDRSHPDSAARSLRADVGGRIVVSLAGRPVTGLRVGGPRKSAVGPIDRYRARLRMRLVRLSPGGSPPIGGNDAAAMELGREEIPHHQRALGPVRMHFGADADLDVQVVDPPPPYLVAVGCTRGCRLAEEASGWWSTRSAIEVARPSRSDAHAGGGAGGGCAGARGLFRDDERERANRTRRPAHRRRGGAPQGRQPCDGVSRVVVGLDHGSDVGRVPRRGGPLRRPQRISPISMPLPARWRSAA